MRQECVFPLYLKLLHEDEFLTRRQASQKILSPLEEYIKGKGKDFTKLTPDKDNATGTIYKWLLAEFPKNR